MKNNTELWIENPSVFIKNEGYLNFIPTRDMNKTEQINSLTLFLLYILIFSYLFKMNNKVLNMSILCLIIVMVILHYGYYNKIENLESVNENDNNYKDQDITLSTGYYDSDNNLKMGKFYSHKKNTPEPSLDRSYEELEKYLKATSRKPTSDNPYMNPVLSDFNTENIPTASNADDEDIKEGISNAFNKDLFRDLNDIYDRKNSQRVFYSVPGGSVPNDQNAFAKWCFDLPPTCNESGEGCLRKFNEDLRYRTSYR
jgi:hypothetical protein